MAQDRWLAAGECQAAVGGPGGGAASHLCARSQAEACGSATGRNGLTVEREGTDRNAIAHSNRLAVRICHIFWSSTCTCSSPTMPYLQTVARSGAMPWVLDSHKPDHILQRYLYLRMSDLSVAGSNNPRHRFPAHSATEGSITIGLRGALGVEITHQTVNVDLHSGCALVPHWHHPSPIMFMPLGSRDECGCKAGPPPV